jgi:DNA-binding FadR family transcriptional regulator
MQAVVDRMAEYIARGITEQEAADLDLRFHGLIYRASRHQRLLRIWATLRHQIYVFLLSRNVADPDFRDWAVRGHQEILDAIRAGDEERGVRNHGGALGARLCSGAPQLRAWPIVALCKDAGSVAGGDARSIYARITSLGGGMR